MADLTGKESSQTVKLTGSDSSGIESNYLEVNANGALNAILEDSSGNELLGIKTSALSIPVVVAQDATYSAAAVGFVCAVAATDVFTISGSATKTIRVRKLEISGTTTSGSTIRLITSTVRRSTANTGGTSVVAVNTSHDSTNAAATAVVRHYTANPTALGTSAGIFRSKTLGITTSGISGGEVERIFGVNTQPIVLRGVTEFLCINFNATTITGPSISISIEWTEV